MTSVTDEASDWLGELRSSEREIEFICVTLEVKLVVLTHIMNRLHSFRNCP